MNAEHWTHTIIGIVLGALLGWFFGAGLFTIIRMVML